MPRLDNLGFRTFGQIGVWHIEEDLPFFYNQLNSSHDLEETVNFSDRRKTEWMACRFLLDQILNQKDPTPLKKDLNGKPYLEGSELNISMSHSHGMAAVSSSLFKNGIDIQLIVPKIIRIREKFISKDERQEIDNFDDIVALHIYWGAKEALYKAFGKRKIDFRQNLRIKPFNSNKEIGQTIGYIQKDQYFETYQINWKKINDEYILVFADQML